MVPLRETRPTAAAHRQATPVLDVFPYSLRTCATGWVNSGRQPADGVTGRRRAGQWGRARGRRMLGGCGGARPGDGQSADHRYGAPPATVTTRSNESDNQRMPY